MEFDDQDGKLIYPFDVLREQLFLKSFNIDLHDEVSRTLAGMLF